MKIVAKIILLIILFPMWTTWLLIDISIYGLDYEEWNIYDFFTK